ncbi:hypothetical protein A606_00665 [Corynebacterium terpenotabidum Y-11]|uniref:Aminotransferase class V domain-containing protein n=1 Tax=Corynebacterium terpenotabidum Y-11 TaxID=1200352 RepID=S4XGK3_9CORY|nr:hypothetical protein A606_00665 [Corynebacterium terpenotabidum Y-11]
MFDSARARGLYVSQSDGWTYLNAGSRAQVPEKVSSAVTQSFRTAPLQADPAHGAGTRGDAYVDAARVAVAELVGGTPECVVLGPSRAALLNILASALPRMLRMGREVVLSRVDDPVNIAPWELAADLYGASVRWAEAELTTGALPTWQFSELIGTSTSIVAVAAANAHIGTVTDVRAIADLLHAKSNGWLVVDAAAYAPYRHIDIHAWEADIVALDLAPLGGPEVGALVFRDPAMLAQLRLAEVKTGRHSTPDLLALAKRRVAALERGGLAPGLLGAVPAAVDFLAGLDETASGGRHERLRISLPAVEEYLLSLARHLVDGLRDFGVVHVVGVSEDDGSYGASNHGESYLSTERVPRVSFLVPGLSASTVVERLRDNGVVAETVGLEDSALFDQMGVAEMGGAVCVAFAPHNTRYDVDQLVRVVGGMV